MHLNKVYGKTVHAHSTKFPFTPKKSHEGPNPVAKCVHCKHVCVGGGGRGIGGGKL
jgi:hypothetical protein